MVKSYSVAEYVVGWLFVVYNTVEKMVDLSQTVFVWSTNMTYTHTHANKQADNGCRPECNAKSTESAAAAQPTAADK